MQLSEIITQARRLTKTNSTNYVDADIKFDINIANGEVHLMILEAEGYKNISGGFKVYDLVSTTGLVAGNIGFNGEYPFSTDTISLEEVHLDYGDGFVKAEIIDRSELEDSMFNDDDIYSELSPKVFVYRDSYFIRPVLTTTTVTDGIKLLARLRQDQLAANDDVPIFETNFHQLIPLKVAQDYFLYYPEKYNPRIDRKVEELESQLISLYQSKTPIDFRIRESKQDRGLKNW